MACKILVLQPGFKLLLSAVKVNSPNHWTALEFPKAVLFYFLHNSYLDIPFGTGLSCQHQNPLSATRVFELNSVTLYVHPAFLLFFYLCFLATQCSMWDLSFPSGIELVPLLQWKGKKRNEFFCFPFLRTKNLKRTVSRPEHPSFFFFLL